MKVILTLVMSIFVLIGCSALAKSDDNDLKWFKTEEEAISHGIKEEKIKKEDIIGEVNEDEEKFIFYKKQLKEGLGVGVSSISEKDGQFAWYDTDQDVLIKNEIIKKYFSQISWDTETQSGKNFTVYTGISKNQNPLIETNKGEISPVVDKKTGIYFYIESTK